MKKLKDGEFIRLYDNNGKHLFSILPCGVEDGEAVDYDLAYPSGKVEYCKVDHELVDSLLKAFPIEVYPSESV